MLNSIVHFFIIERDMRSATVLEHLIIFLCYGMSSTEYAKAHNEIHFVYYCGGQLWSARCRCSMLQTYVQRPCLVNDGSFFEMLCRHKVIRPGS